MTEERQPDNNINKPEAVAMPPGVTLYYAHSDRDLPFKITRSALAKFVHESMNPYEDSITDTIKGLDYALSSSSERTGFVILAMQHIKLVGAVVILETGMGAYVPENLLLYITVTPSFRGKGVGGYLLRAAQNKSRGSIALHVEPENPALILYERNGFTNKYLEMRSKTNEQNSN